MNKFTVSCLVAGALLVPIAGYSADSDMDRDSPKAFVKDSVITTKVKTELAAEKPGTLVHIRVDTDRDGIVYLSGTAPSQRARERAVEIARNVGGVVSVHDDIRIQSE